MIAHSSMACIAVYQDKGANPAIETIPPVSAQLATNYVWLIIIHGGKRGMW